MGLDMYGYTMRAEFAGDRQTDVMPRTDEEREQAQLSEDLERLEQALEKDELEYTPGFFFGGAEIYPENIETTRAFIQNARAALNQGLAVFYDSWW